MYRLNKNTPFFLIKRSITLKKMIYIIKFGHFTNLFLPILLYENDE